MTFLESSKTMSLIIFLAVIFVFGMTTSNAQQAVDISGKIKAVYTKHEPINVGDIEGHTVGLSQSEGTNENTGKQVFMDGASVVNLGFTDVVKGNGDQQGYVVFTKNDDAMYAAWEGKVATTITSEGTASTSFEGTYTYIKGTGKFDGLSGSGTFKGIFTSESEYTVEWQGEYLLKK